MVFYSDGSAVFRRIDKMHAIFIMSFLANVILALVSSAILPDQVAIHFGQGGRPDGWATNLASTLIMVGVHSIVFCSLYFSPRLLTSVPIKWISLPNRDYWLRPERRSQARMKFSQHIWQFGTALFLFMLFAGLLSLKANLSDPVRLDEGPLFIALVIFLVYTGYWTVTLVRSFRIPPDN
jgi:uncharacterized membrane protein